MGSVELGGVVPDQRAETFQLVMSNIEPSQAVLGKNRPEAIIVFLLSISGSVEAASQDISGHQNWRGARNIADTN